MVNNLKSNKCVFFSAFFPYETTLENELKILSQEFDTIYYLPKKINSNQNDIALPVNVKLSFDLSDSFDSWRNNTFKQWFLTSRLFIASLFEERDFYNYIKHWKDYFVIAARNVKMAEILEEFIKKNDLEDAVFYDYWFENVTLSLAILKKAKVIKTFVCRVHGFDLHDEIWKGGRVPYRKFKLKHLDAIYSISEYGRDYLTPKIPDKYINKLRLSYLGIDIGETLKTCINQNNEKIIVSASNTQDFKRVHLIPEVLSKLQGNIRWIHFGTGPNDRKVLENIKKNPSNIKIEIRGYVPNAEILKFYSENSVDLFISLSTTEGLPISMMEAISYGIPVFAANICGIPELVTEDTGSMFELEDTMELIARKLQKQLDKEIDSQKVFNFAKEKFDYRKNYKDFYKQIKVLHKLNMKI